MKPLLRFSCAVVLAILSAGTGGAAILVATGSEDPNPYPGTYMFESPDVWFKFPHPDEILESSAPITHDPTNPVITGSTPQGTDREITLYYFTGTGWSEPRFLTDNDTDDLEPTIVRDPDGSLHVSWWQQTGIFYTRVVATEGTVQIESLGGGGSRPSVAVGTQVFVAYQRPGAAGTEIVFAERGVSGWSTQVIATTAFAGPAGNGDIDVQVHTRDGRLWVDWVNAGGRIGYSSRDAGTGWSPVQEAPYSWGGPIDETEFWAREMARVSIRQQVLAD